MRIVWLIALMMALALAGCANKNTANPAPGHAPNDNSGTAGNPSAGTGGGGGTAGGVTNQQPAGGGAAAGGATQQPAAGGGAAAKPPENLAKMTRAQYDKITGAITYDQVVKLVGSSGKLIAETGDKKTYQFQLKDDPKYYVNIVFNKGVLSEKSIFAL